MKQDRVVRILPALFACSMVAPMGNTALGQLRVPGVTMRLPVATDLQASESATKRVDILYPTGEGLWFKVNGGQMYHFMRFDAGWYRDPCGAMDWPCNWESGTPFVENVVEDPDYVPIGEAGKCKCKLAYFKGSAWIDLLLDENYALFTFTSGAEGGCFDDPFDICPPASQKMIAEAYNTFSLSVEDRSKSYQGRVHVWGRLRATSLALGDDGCDAIDSHIQQEISARYSNPPDTQSLEPSVDLQCAFGGFDVAKFVPAANQLDAYSASVGEGQSLPEEDSGWVRLTPTGGICLGDDFSFGFKFAMDLEGTWIWAPVLTLELGITTTSGSCP